MSLHTMSSTNRILYIGGGREIAETLKKAKPWGLEIIYIQHKERFREELLPYVDRVVLIDYEDIDVLIPICKTLQSLFPFASAISMNEDALIPTAYVCDALGLPGNSIETVKTLKDKSLMRQRLNQLGFSPVAAQVGYTLSDMLTFVQDNGLPIVIKPTDASGSLGVFRVDDTAQLEEIWQQVQALNLSSFLMEEYLDGPEISVESFTFHGRHVVLAATDKVTLSNHVEIGHSIPAQLNAETYEQVVLFVKTFLDAVKLEEGPAHTEIKLTKKGLRIIESHNRPGGDRINELVQVAYGIDMKAMTLGWFCGVVEPLETSPQLQAGAAIRFLAPPAGIVQEISGLEVAQQSTGLVEMYVWVEVGDRINVVNESYDRSGHIIATGVTVQEAIDRCEQISQQVQIITVER
ncbi:MAG: ATP-grasp domain-containing protein [Aphanothece sp. CMT-3BRIN-NPC111]|nr:ATP-grasp domain-containing protein [Aphanothece sp. CMT-3BRIN-NPC111]